MEPEWKVVGQICFRNGRKRYFKYASLDLNSLGASEIAKDKDYANFFMRRMGYPTIAGRKFYSNEWAKAIGSKQTIDAAYKYAASLGFPVIVKPNSGSQGIGVSKVYTKTVFYKALRFVFKRDKVALVQRPVSGKDYRIVVLDNEVISAYERVPLNIVGDGMSSVKKLLAEKQSAFILSGRDTKIKPDDFRIAEKLKRQGLTMKSAPENGVQVFLLDNANLSSGGDSIDVTNAIHPEFQAMAIRLTKDMGLRLCGVDIMVKGDIKNKPEKYWVLEINSAPGLDHYAKSGKEQEKIVEEMYLKVLKAME
jgi:D-alanine-D-alanine ligase-like ATP-grasp enzyme